MGVNDGLMAVFFFLIGLEIKRELLIGELNSIRKATFPIFAAVGGMAIPPSTDAETADYSAVQMFVDHATRISSDFTLEDWDIKANTV